MGTQLTYQELLAAYNKLLMENEYLHKEVDRLQSLLSSKGASSTLPAMKQHLSLEEKVETFCPGLWNVDCGRMPSCNGDNLMDYWTDNMLVTYNYIFDSDGDAIEMDVLMESETHYVLSVNTDNPILEDYTSKGGHTLKIEYY